MAYPEEDSEDPVGKVSVVGQIFSLLRAVRDVDARPEYLPFPLFPSNSAIPTDSAG